MRRYVVIATLHDGTQEVYGPMVGARVERFREQCESAGWVERVSVAECFSVTNIRAELKHAKGGTA